MRTVKFDADVMAAMKARAEKAERERDEDAERYVGAIANWTNLAAKLERERDEAWENYQAEYRLKLECGLKLIKSEQTIERIEALVERWRKECPETPGWADELEAVLKEVK